ncbi:MAG: hypothetical protein ACFFBR_00035 [Promethearchaeota archaeon]
MSPKLIINDSWVLQRNGSFSTSFSGFLRGITGGAKLSEIVKSSLDTVRTVSDFGGPGFVQPLLESIIGKIGVDIPPAIREKIQRKLDLAQKESQEKLAKAEEQYEKRLDAQLEMAEKEYEKKIEAVMEEKEKAYEAKLNHRLAKLEADQEKLQNSVGQQVAYQLFSTKIDSLVDALYSVAKERGITNEEILRIIKALPEFEALMYIMNVRKFYRDHTAHSLRVATLGDYLLEKEGNAGELQQLLREKMNLTKEEVQTTWWFTGLLHDIGTPLAKLVTSLNWSLINEMTRCYSPLGMDFSPLQIGLNHPDLGNVGYLKILTKGYPKKWHTFIANGLGKVKEAPNAFRYLATDQHKGEYKPPSLKIDHGVVAAVTLLRTLGPPEYVEQENPKDRPLIEAARTIALHDVIENLGPLPFEDYPLLFLLAICDELQEWGRPIPISTEDGYFTTALQKFSLTEAIYHDSGVELWDIPFTNAQAKSLMSFDFKRIHSDKAFKLKGLDCTQQFPETDMLLIDYDKNASKVIEKYEIPIHSH